ncbi:hypothetical protein [Telmatospirillum siberiense]|uniref:Uncharacterized protein n=1 Tax=Telmatospirillum siberiense TaxID=382514 RepID=A0A2N3Q0X9_9PROT|nr:hypothetical protein [Telmatospirillum siberiense]PKU26307.1 hypothetical protein CWS72_00155 [Telmatospirillum siberiense]
MDAKNAEDFADIPPFLVASRWRWPLLAGSVILVASDGLFWHGLLFGSRFWHLFLWVLVAVGFSVGGYAYWRRSR